MNVIAKCFEPIIFDGIYKTVKNQVLPEQHGFIKPRYIDTSLISFCEFMYGTWKIAGKWMLFISTLERLLIKLTVSSYTILFTNIDSLVLSLV